MTGGMLVYVSVALVPEGAKIFGSLRALMEGGDGPAGRSRKRNIGVKAVNIIRETFAGLIGAQLAKIHVEGAVFLHEENNVLDLAQIACTHDGYRDVGACRLPIDISSRGRVGGSCGRIHGRCPVWSLLAYSWLNVYADRVLRLPVQRNALPTFHLRWFRGERKSQR